MPDNDILAKLKADIAGAGNDSGQSKVRQAAERLRGLGVDVPDDVVDDFDKVTGLESSRSHYSAPGVVKRGAPTASGERAIGYGQIMPSTAKKYTDKYGL